MLDNLSLRSKIIAGGLLPLVLVAFINILGIVNFNGVVESYQWVDQTRKIIEKGMEIRKEAGDMETGMRGFLLSGDESFLEPYNSSKSGYQTAFAELKQLVKDQEALRSLTNAERIIAEWDEKIAQRYIKIRKESERSAHVADEIGQIVAKKEGKNYFDSFRQEMRSFVAREEELLRQRVQEADDVTSRTNAIIIFGTGIALVMALLIAFVMVRIITNPISAIKEAALKISRGETDVTVEVQSRDELSEMANAFQVMAKNLNDTSEIAHRIGQGDLTVRVDKRSDKDVLGNALQNLIDNLNAIMSELKESTTVLGGAASEILATTAQVSSGASQTSSAVTQTSASIEEIKQTARASSAKATHTAESTGKTMENAKVGVEALEENMRGLEQIREKMDLIGTNIVQLSEQSQMIGEIITTVEDIANQSNLLAVNASIEAVKAGEHGKGFSVVAQELKNLAEQSKDGTKQVQKILSEIQKATGTLVMVAEQGGNAVKSGMQQAQNARETMEKLNQRVADAAKAGKQIAASYEQELAGMDQIVGAMSSIKEATAQNVDSVRQVEDSARNLNTLSQKLADLMARYTVVGIR